MRNQSDSRYISSIVYWVVYDTIEQNGPEHAMRDEDWATKSEIDNFAHLMQHVSGYVISEARGNDRDTEQNLRHLLVRAAMMYWAWLRDKKLLKEAMTFPDGFLEYLERNST